MICIITRTEEDKQQTKGKLSLYSIISEEFKCKEQLDFECKTLELPWRKNKRTISRIPAGTYSAIKHVSADKGKSIWLRNVPDRSEILIHRGNYAGSDNPHTGEPDTLGCILVGRRFLDINADDVKEVTSSRQTMNELYSLVPDEFEITIKEKFDEDFII